LKRIGRLVLVLFVLDALAGIAAGAYLVLHPALLEVLK